MRNILNAGKGRTVAYLGVATLFAWGLASCKKASPTSPQADAPATRYSFSGNLQNPDGSPLAGALVYLAPEGTSVSAQIPGGSFPSTISGANGNWIIRLYANGTHAMGVGQNPHMAILDADGDNVGDGRGYGISPGNPVTQTVEVNNDPDGTWISYSLPKVNWESGETLTVTVLGHNYGVSDLVLNPDIVQASGGLETVLGSLGPVTLTAGADLNIVVLRVIDTGWPTVNSQPGSNNKIVSTHGRSANFNIFDAATPTPGPSTLIPTLSLTFSATPGLPTDTPTVSAGTLTYTLTITNTLVPGTDTLTPTPAVGTATSTRTVTPTWTGSPTGAPGTSTLTITPTPAPGTSTFSPTAAVGTATSTRTVTPTSTGTPTGAPGTSTLTITPTPVPGTSTFSPTAAVGTATSTRTVTPTWTGSPTAAPGTSTFTITPTAVPFTPTLSPTP